MASISSSLLPDLEISSKKIVAQTIETVSLATVSTEVSHALPSGTIAYCLKNRDDGLLKLGFVAASTDGTDYWTLFPGVPYNSTSSSAILDEGTSFTIYLQSPKPSQLVEVISWQ